MLKQTVNYLFTFQRCKTFKIIYLIMTSNLKTSVTTKICKNIFQSNRTHIQYRSVATL